MKSRYNTLYSIGGTVIHSRMRCLTADAAVARVLLPSPVKFQKAAELYLPYIFHKSSEFFTKALYYLYTSSINIILLSIKQQPWLK